MNVRAVTYLGFTFAIAGVLAAPLAGIGGFVSPVAALSALACATILMYANRGKRPAVFDPRVAWAVWSVIAVSIGLLFYNGATMGDHAPWHRVVNSAGSPLVALLLLLTQVQRHRQTDS